LTIHGGLLIAILGSSDVLVGGDVLPGFNVPVGSLF
jgi:hypothetical protein